MNDVREIKLICTTLECRGKGTEGDPVRRITQLWTHDGKLVAEASTPVSFTRRRSPRTTETRRKAGPSALNAHSVRLAR